MASGRWSSFYAVNNGLARVASDQAPEWHRMFWGSASYWYTVAVLTPIFLWLPRRFAFTRDRWLHTAAVYLVALSVLAVIHIAVYLPLRELLFPIDVSFLHLLRKTFLIEVISLAGVLAVAQALEYGAQLKEREVRASQLEAAPFAWRARAARRSGSTTCTADSCSGRGRSRSAPPASVVSDAERPASTAACSTTESPRADGDSVYFIRDHDIVGVSY